ncbi:MAG: hypothetical protein R6V10_15555 [bacterium]
MKKATLVLVVSAALVLAFVYHRRIYQDDEKRIREIISKIEKHAEAKNTDGMMEYVSDDYSDDSGLNKFYLRRMLQSRMGELDELKVEIKDLDVFVSGEKATVNLALTAQATRKGKIFFPLGSEDKPEHPKITFRKTGTGDWEIIEIDNVDTGPKLGI